MAAAWQMEELVGRGNQMCYVGGRRPVRRLAEGASWWQVHVPATRECTTAVVLALDV